MTAVLDLPPRTRVAERPEWLLRRGIRTLIECDGAEVVESLAAFMFRQHRALRVLSAILERSRGTIVPSVITLLGGLKAYIMVRRPRRGDGVLWVARLANERRALEPLRERIPELEWSEIRLNWRIGLADVAALMGAFATVLPRLMRISRRLHERHASFKVLRAVELCGYYMRYLRIFRSGDYSLAVLSSHSNPHGVAFNLAARRSGVPVMLVSHGMPVRPVARLAFDLAVVHCDDAHATYVEEGCRLDRVLTHGRRQHYRPMPRTLPDSLTVCVCLCKDVNEDRLRALVASLLDSPRVARIRLRPHPFNMWVGLHDWHARLGDARVELVMGASVYDDIHAADVVLAGNTSVHIEALVAGCPSAYVAGLDDGGDDLHRFVERGLVFPLPDSLDLDLDALLRFYEAPAWPHVLRRFANVDEDGSVVEARTAAIVRELIAAETSPGLGP